MDDKRKIAAVAAVMAYIRQDEDIVCAQFPAPPPSRQPVPPQPLNIWALSGRQAQMQFRNLMQTKAFHGPGMRPPMR